MQDESTQKESEQVYDKMFQEQKAEIEKLIEKHKNEVLENPKYKEQVKYSESMIFDFINTIRLLSLYSGRYLNFYKDSMSIEITDEIIESLVGILNLIREGIYNNPKREIRYMIELVAKIVMVDELAKGKKLKSKITYLKKNIDNSSVDIIKDIQFPFEDKLNSDLKSEIKSNFKKMCAYVHPSEKQLLERLSNKDNRNTIGFDSIKMLSDFNRTMFRNLDIILFMLLYSFDSSLCKDLLKAVLESNAKWKYKHGKYTKAYIKLLKLL